FLASTAMTSHIDELTVNAAVSAQYVATSIINRAVAAGNVHHHTVDTALEAVNSVISMQIDSYPDLRRQKTGRRLTNTVITSVDTEIMTNSSVNVGLINNTHHILQQYGRLISMSMVPDQAPVTTIHGNYRVITYKLSAST